jgi:hypothetical protein
MRLQGGQTLKTASSAYQAAVGCIEARGREQAFQFFAKLNLQIRPAAAIWPAAMASVTAPVLLVQHDGLDRFGNLAQQFVDPLSRPFEPNESCMLARRIRAI